MSFNPVVKTEASQKKNEESSLQTSQQQLVAYRGREVEFPSSLPAKVSFVDTIFLRMGHIMGMDMSIVKNRLPPAFSKMVNGLDAMFQGMDKSSRDHLFYFWHQ
jgi:hypothetical protein